MTAQPMKIGLVGAGSIAQAYLQAIQNTPLADFSAVADVRPEAAKTMAEQAGCGTVDSYRDMLDGEVEGAIVCTPPNTHCEIATAFLEQGIPVLCEKPLTIDIPSAVSLKETSERTGTLLTMGSKFRFVEDVSRAKSIVESGILGEIILFENAFTARVDMGHRWNSKPEVSGGGVLIDNGTHSVDIIRYFLGPIAEVQAVEGKRVQGLAVEETVQIFVRSTTGVMGTIDLSWSLQKELETYINIYGSNGVVQVGWKRSRYRQSTSPDWIEFGSGYRKVDAFRRNVENFVHAVRGEEAILVTPVDALASVEVVDAAYESLRGTRWVQVSPEKEGAGVS